MRRRFMLLGFQWSWIAFVMGGAAYVFLVAAPTAPSKPPGWLTTGLAILWAAVSLLSAVAAACCFRDAGRSREED